MPRNALGHALGQNNIENFELLRGFITIQGIVPPPPQRGPIYTYNVDTFPKFLTPPPPLAVHVVCARPPSGGSIAYRVSHSRLSQQKMQ